MMSDIWDMQFIHESTLSSGYQNPRCPLWIIWRWNFDFKSMGAKTFTMWTSMTGPTIVSPRNWCMCSASWVCSRSVYSRHNGMICPKPSSSSGRVLQLIPADTGYQNDVSSQTFVNWIVSDSESESWMFARRLFPDAGLREDTKRFTSCEFTLLSIPLFTGSPLSSSSV